MGFTKFNVNADFNGKGAMSLPDQPTISASALKAKFDEPSRDVIAPKVNTIVGELEATTSAANLGATAPAGRTGSTVQAVINSVSSDLATLEAAAGTAIADAHTHSNKTVIDKFADSGSGLTYDGNPVGEVTSVNSQTGAVVLTASDVGALPSSTTIPSKTSDLTNDSNFVADASYVHTDNNYDATAKGIVDGATAAIAAKSTVSWNQIDTTGTKIAEITIDGVKTDVKATGGGSADAYKTIESGGQSFVASGADTFKINAGSNVTITPLTGDKGIQISAAGGGTSTGDMLMSDYDPSGTVKSSTNGITGYVANAISGKADTSSLATVATSGAYADLSGQPSIPTVTDTYSGTSSDGMSGKAVKSAIDALDVTVSGAGAGKTLATLTETDGKIAATFQNISITKSQVSDFPTIPTVTDTYSSSSHDGMSGVAVASAISGKANTSELDGWTTASQVQSDGTVTFTGLNDNYGYDIFAEDILASVSQMTKTGSGTNVTLVYKTDAPQGTNCKLRILK